MGDYPDDAELRTLSAWDRSPSELVDYLRDGHWWMPDWGLRVEAGDQYAPRGDGDEPHWWISLSTAGWSGNEDRIDALRHTPGLWYGFWSRYWYCSRRGGHYQFAVPAAKWHEAIVPIAVPA